MIGDEIRRVVEALRSQLSSRDPDVEVFVHGFRHLEAMADLADLVEGRPVPLPMRIVPSRDAAAPVVDLAAWRRGGPAS